ncbi:hypothetical protein FD755_019592 [Muntiacus reevesi]|uniref:Translin n=1 Tax=Muntiacus reevesi TaxID=9886 RepID=A0A5N3X5Z3_MUNRE|nr:hypothetical protein FD755_019592 [Muntiacus reevesi]
MGSGGGLGALRRPARAARAARAVSGAHSAGHARSPGGPSVSESVVGCRAFWLQDIREEIRKVVQSLEQTAREILTLLQGVHQGAGFQDIPKRPKRRLKAGEHFGTVKTHLMSLRRRQRHPLRALEVCAERLAFLAASVVYLESETIVTREAVTATLGVEPDQEKGSHLDVEESLSGVLILASELPRLSMDSGTAGDDSRPLHTSTFTERAGIRLLKCYDGLKHGVKEVEEVLCDLSLRGFNAEPAAARVKQGRPPAAPTPAGPARPSPAPP